jgi:hypothetical protein
MSDTGLTRNLSTHATEPLKAWCGGVMSSRENDLPNCRKHKWRTSFRLPTEQDTPWHIPHQ